MMEDFRVVTPTIGFLVIKKAKTMRETTNLQTLEVVLYYIDPPPPTNPQSTLREFNSVLLKVHD